MRNTVASPVLMDMPSGYAFDLQERREPVKGLKGFIMRRYQWAALNKQQAGAFAEYFVKMELTMYGFEVYTTEVDDRGIDFVARKAHGPFIEVQVKSLRDYGYVFMHKTKFELRSNVFLALGLLFDDQAPRLFLIPATAWLTPNELFVDRPYEGMKSKPEWGLNVSRKNLPLLEAFAYDEAVKLVAGPDAATSGTS